MSAGLIKESVVSSDAKNKKAQIENVESLFLPLQDVSIDIWDQKYRLKTVKGEPLEKDIDATFKRIAIAISDVEKNKALQAKWRKKFEWAMHWGAIPAGRIISNAGIAQHRPATSTVNCTVSGLVEDSMEDVLNKVQQAGITLKAGCGIGYEFSTLRPRDSYVNGSGACTSGPLSFMDIFDSMCFSVSSAGGRRGAQMATLDVSHPDVLDFIKAKREDGRLRQFNLSLLITDEFMQAVKFNDDWPLVFPLCKKEQDREQLDLANSEYVIWKDWPITKDYIVNNDGQVACKVHRTIAAQKLWDVIMASTYDFAEPGFILVDKVNQMNNNWFCENIRSTNSCGEQPLPPHGSSLLGSINLTRFVDQPFTKQAQFNWKTFKEVVAVFTRMLDNVVEINGLPLPEQQDEMRNKRRHGMGYLGLGSSITMLGMKYGDAASQGFTEEVTRQLAIVGWQQGLALAKEKGPAPIMEQEFELTCTHFRLRPELARDGYKLGDTVKGKILHAKYSRYMQQFAEDVPELVSELAQIGSRFTHHSSIAPTGTISLSIANNASNGIEPSFAHHYARNIIKPGRKTKEKVDVYSYELLAYRALHGLENETIEAIQKQLPDYFITSDAVTPQQHVDIQAAAQKWIDAAISKTANVPSDYPFEKFKHIYQYAYDKSLKGCTTFRFNPEVFQGVLVQERDLESTRYKFTLSNGEVVELKGNELLEYDGETHIAANLYDALKEGYYGKL
jgi:ribonucleoside-diphosphate reductase alpha chain